jgi:ABC-type amino acid transport system permease subunit
MAAGTGGAAMSIFKKQREAAWPLGWLRAATFTWAILGQMIYRHADRLLFDDER